MQLLSIDPGSYLRRCCAWAFLQLGRAQRAFDYVARKDGHHPIVFMQCGPVRHRVNPKEQAAARPFQHTVMSARRTFARSVLRTRTCELNSRICIGN
jgi:hypothetical protein